MKFLVAVLFAVLFYCIFIMEDYQMEKVMRMKSGECRNLPNFKVNQLDSTYTIDYYGNKLCRVCKK